MLELQPKLKNVKKAKKQMKMELKMSKDSKKNNLSNKVEQTNGDKQKQVSVRNINIFRLFMKIR